MRDYGRFGDLEDSGNDTRSLLIECGFHGDPASRAVAQDQCVRFIEQSGALSADALAQQLPAGACRRTAPVGAGVTGPVVATSSAFRFVAPYTGLEVFEKAGTVIGDNDGVPVVTPLRRLRAGHALGAPGVPG